jgi:hypothetical protein
MIRRRMIFFGLGVSGLLGCDRPLPGLADCRVYRPRLAKQTFDGHVGAVLLHNATTREAEVRLYHPDGQGDVELRRRAAPGKVLVLQSENGERLALGNDWGIQVNGSCVATLGQAGKWSLGEFTLRWDGDSLRAGVGATRDDSPGEPTGAEGS